MKRWKILLYLLLVVISCVLLYKRTVLPWPYAVRTFEEVPIDDWYAPVVACHANEKGEMVFESYGFEYHYTSNSVTGVVTIERWRK